MSKILASVWWTRAVETVDAEVPTYELASWGRRILSAIIDAFAIGFLSLPFTGAASRHFLDASVVMSTGV